MSEDQFTARQTLRGFDRIEFKDRYAVECSLQKSSLAFEDCIWLGCNSPTPVIMASQAAAHGVATSETTGWVAYPMPDAVQCNTRMHLSREQVAVLLPYLQRFVETGEIGSRTGMMTITELNQALDEISRWLAWDSETINDFHTYAQRYGGKPGGNVYTFVLTEALRGRGLTIEQFRKEAECQSK